MPARPSERLHAGLLADPLRPVASADIAALADADARENWTFMVNFRDRLVAAPSLEAVYVTLARKGAGDLPPIFLSQLCHLILRNALEGCDDPYMLRAAELFYRSQLATVHDGTLLLADAEVIEAQQHAQHDIHSSPLTAMLAPKVFGEMDVMDDDNAWTYWSRSDAHAMVMNIGGNAKARAGLCRVIERWRDSAQADRSSACMSRPWPACRKPSSAGRRPGWRTWSAGNRAWRPTASPQMPLFTWPRGPSAAGSCAERAGPGQPVTARGARAALCPEGAGAAGSAFINAALCGYTDTPAPVSGHSLFVVIEQLTRCT